MHRTFKTAFLTLFFFVAVVYMRAEVDTDEKMDIKVCVAELKSQSDLVFERANQCLYDAIPDNTIILIKAMDENTEPVVRGRLALLFAKRQIKDAVPTIIKLASDKDIVVRRYAVSALHDMTDVRAISTLMNTMREDDFAMQADSVGAILKMRDIVTKKDLAEVKDLLVLRLKHPKKIMRENAVRNLGELGDPKVIPLIENLLQTDTFYYIATQKINGKTIEKKVFPVREAAEKSIKRIKEKPAQPLTVP